MARIPIEKLIQRQIHQWDRYRELLGITEKTEEIPPRPIITISRERGAGAQVVAEALAKRLDLEVHGATLVDHIARDENLERAVIEHLDEAARSQIELWVKGVLKQRIFLRDNYHVSLVRAVKTLAAHGGVVFVGRGANIILEETASLRLLLVAPVEARIRNVMWYDGVDEPSARRIVARTDAQRAEFLRKLFHVEPNDPLHYDLVVNTDRLPVPRVVQIVMEALEVRGAFAG